MSQADSLLLVAGVFLGVWFLVYLSMRQVDKEEKSRKAKNPGIQEEDV